jgi:hypothetical protein
LQAFAACWAYVSAWCRGVQVFSAAYRG